MTAKKVGKGEKNEAYDGQPTSGSSNSNSDGSTTWSFPNAVCKRSNDYAENVRAWLWAYQCAQWYHTCIPLYLSSHLSRVAPPRPTVNNNASRQQPTTTTPNDRSYVITPLHRRLAAECFDFIFFFTIGFFVLIALEDRQWIDMSYYEQLFNPDVDLATVVKMTQQMVPLELLKKVVVSVVEAGFICYGFGLDWGCTPGKFYMGIRVIHCDSIVPVNPNENRVIIISTCYKVGFFSALLRSLLKNFALGFLFPLYLPMYCFAYNRSLYDVLARTVVVEMNDQRTS